MIKQKQKEMYYNYFKLNVSILLSLYKQGLEKSKDYQILKNDAFQNFQMMKAL